MLAKKWQLRFDKTICLCGWQVYYAWKNAYNQGTTKCFEIYTTLNRSPISVLDPKMPLLLLLGSHPLGMSVIIGVCLLRTCWKFFFSSRVPMSLPKILLPKSGGGRIRSPTVAPPVPAQPQAQGDRARRREPDRGSYKAKHEMCARFSSSKVTVA